MLRGVRAVPGKPDAEPDKDKGYAGPETHTVSTTFTISPVDYAKRLRSSLLLLILWIGTLWVGYSVPREA